MSNYVKINGSWNEVLKIFRREENVWVEISETLFRNYVLANINLYGGYNNVPMTLEIMGLSDAVGESSSYVLLMNGISNVTNLATWYVVDGGEYASISSGGVLTINSNANESTVTISASYSGSQATKIITATYLQGTTTETETETVVDESGNTQTTTTTTTTNEDGSSESYSTTIITDESGNTVGSVESETQTNSDGSYNSSSTSFDENGDAVNTTNASGDTDGNVSTQNIEYDESGNSIVTGYSIDTSENPDGEKDFNLNGVNTEYYAFDMTHGFELNIHFAMNYNNQPTGQNENHHNILTMKRANPTPWYGFQLRQTGTNKYIILGTQFSTGSNTNTNITGVTTSVTNEYEFDLTITYNPTASGTKFICYDNLRNKNVYTSNLVFPDIDELKYLKVTIGYALDTNGNPYRYSNIKVYNFYINRI